MHIFRFDLIFILLDTIDIDGDKKIADHVIRMHRFRSEFELDGESLTLGKEQNFASYQRLSHSNRNSVGFSGDMFEKFNEILHGSNINGNSKIFTLPFFIKYVQVARALKPSLTTTASDLISTEYTRLRSQDLTHTDIAKTQPVTARTLESLIRISTAHAKARISKYVEAIDVEVAISLINYAYFKDVSMQNIGLPSSDSSDDHEHSELIAKSRIPPEGEINSNQEMYDLSDDIFGESFFQFQKHAFLSFSDAHVDSLMVAELYSSINLYSSMPLMTNEIFHKYLSKMEESNQIMVSEGVVYLI
ncbi:DNA replication licensing factor Mcm3 [Oopsacas minuta]|uniref:DNA replication licensing factor MCM3 n=1 Tax=Oopsacas minuta TaxID=111878 RepID=A0AAV7JI60_9METZ|nr:DNA replication licensing factor Mcm3 [Oopsacas minuta]